MVTNSIISSSTGKYPIEQCRHQYDKLHIIRPGGYDDLARSRRYHQQIQAEEPRSRTHQSELGTGHASSSKDTLHLLLVIDGPNNYIDPMLNCSPGHRLLSPSHEIGPPTSPYPASTFSPWQAISLQTRSYQPSWRVARHQCTLGSVRSLSMTRTQ